MGCPDDVLDLPAIEILLGQLVERRGVHPFKAGFWGYSEYECSPQVSAGLVGQSRILDGKMDTRLECIIKGANTISSKKHYAFVVLEHA